MTSKDGSSLLIVAAEASSALYGQRLLEIFKEQSEDIECFGIGSRAMEDLGFQCLGRSEELAVVGLVEVLKHFGQIRETFNGILERCEKNPPKCALLLDYPDFNLRLAKKLKKMGIPVVYFISPQLWAWRTGRIKEIQKNIAKMLVLFPFEEGFYQSHGVAVDFVGHPLLDELDDKYFDKNQMAQFRKKQNLNNESMVLGLMPGSRNSEISFHLDTQLKVAKNLSEKYPYLQIVLLLAPSLDDELIESRIDELNAPVRIVKEDPLEMIAIADVLLCASGTATLMVGLLEKPMVIMYKMNRLTAYIAKKLVNKVKYFGLPNLILGEEALPERFQKEASVEELSSQIAKILDDEPYRDSLKSKLKGLRPRLGSKGAMKRVYESLKRDYF